MTIRSTVWTTLATFGATSSVILAVFGISLFWQKKDKRFCQLKTNSERCPGLWNLGRTCFANSLLQSLASCPAFVGWLQRLPGAGTCSPSSFLFQLRHLMNTLNQANSSTDSAQGVIEALERHGWLVGSMEEQDLFELLNVFISVWEEELGIDSAPSASLQGLADICHMSDAGLSENSLSFPSWNMNIKDERMRGSLQGLCGTQLQCSRCARKRVRHDKISALSLALPREPGSTPVTLESCLRKYFARELVRNTSCDWCHEREGISTGSSSHLKKHGLSKLPLTLVLRMERRQLLPTGHLLKRDDFVRFPEVLDVGDFLFYRPPTDSAFRRPLYLLRSVAIHLGSADSGHFAVYRRGLGCGPVRSWWYISDAVVRKASLQQVLAAEAYMFLYERLQVT